MADDDGKYEGTEADKVKRVEVDVMMHIRTYWREAEGNPQLRLIAVEVWPLPPDASTALGGYLQAAAQHWLNHFGFTETQPMEQTAAPPGTPLN